MQVMAFLKPRKWVEGSSTGVMVMQAQHAVTFLHVQPILQQAVGVAVEGNDVCLGNTFQSV